MVLCGNRTPSPSRDQVLRAHSPWTALRQRKKGRQDSRAAAPLRESDDDDGNAENRAPAGGLTTQVGASRDCCAFLPVFLLYVFCSVAGSTGLSSPHWAVMGKG
eukprot:1147447-Pelagomonas_calceolata.AAC.9